MEANIKFIKRNFLIIFFIIILLFFVLFPIYWMVSSSFKVEDEIFRTTPTWFPENFTLEHFKAIFTQFEIHRYMLNSVIIAIGTTIISVILGSTAAYGFSRFKFRGSNILLILMLLVRLLTPAALIVPLYDLIAQLGLVDSVLSIILSVTLLNLPFVLWIMKVFFDDFPIEIEEAAKIDGCSYFQIFIRIIIPCSLPAIATVILFSFILGWNDFLFSLSFSRSINSMPATVVISRMITQYKIYWGPLMAGGTFLSIPIVLITLLLQKYFVKGITMGAVKE